MNDECLIFGIPSCGSLETTHIGTVAEFGLGITANIFIILSLFQKLLVLFSISLIAEGDLYDRSAGNDSKHTMRLSLPGTCSRADRTDQVR